METSAAIRASRALRARSFAAAELRAVADASGKYRVGGDATAARDDRRSVAARRLDRERSDARRPQCLALDVGGSRAGRRSALGNLRSLEVDLSQGPRDRARQRRPRMGRENDRADDRYVRVASSGHLHSGIRSLRADRAARAKRAGFGSQSDRKGLEVDHRHAGSPTDPDVERLGAEGKHPEEDRSTGRR